MVENIVGSLHLTLPKIQSRVISEFNKVHPDFGQMINKKLEEIGKSK